MCDEETRTKIRALNDAFRDAIVLGTPIPGKIYMTRGVNDLGEPFCTRALAAVALAKDDAFTEAIDPHGEHDMIRVVVDGVTVWAKFDYYAKDDPDLGSEDPSDETKTERVLTLLLPEEY